MKTHTSIRFALSFLVLLTLGAEPGPADQTPPPAPALVAPEEPAAADPLRCPLTLSTVVLAEGVTPVVRPVMDEGYGLGVVADPVAVEGGVLVAYMGWAGEDLLVYSQLWQPATGVSPPLLLRQDHALTGIELVPDGTGALLAYTLEASARLANVDAAGAAGLDWPSTGSAWLSELATSGDHLVLVYPDYGPSPQTVLVRPGLGTETITLTHPRPYHAELPRDGGVAAGPQVDVAVYSREETAGAHVLEAAVFPLDPAIAPTIRRIASGSAAMDGAVAVGPDGFAVVWGDADLTGVFVQRLDASGAPSGEPIQVVGPEAGGVTRFPRITALGTGWVVSWWDGVGPMLVRLGTTGAALEAPFPVRTGEERGGHTGAAMAAMPNGLAVIWTIQEPLFGAGPEPLPNPGPRLGILTCTPSP